MFYLNAYLCSVTPSLLLTTRKERDNIYGSTLIDQGCRARTWEPLTALSRGFISASITNLLPGYSYNSHPSEVRE